MSNVFTTTSQSRSAPSSTVFNCRQMLTGLTVDGCED